MEPTDTTLDIKKKLIKASTAKETGRALKKHWQLYTNWCAENGFTAFPAEAKIYEAYFIHLYQKGYKRASIDQAKWALDTWQRQNKLSVISNDHDLKAFFKGLHRLLGFQQDQKKELTIDHIKQMTFSDDLAGLRDKTILLVGFSTGLRRSELTGVCVEDIFFSSLGARLTIRKSKTNQQGRREEVELPLAKDKLFCPVSNLQLWLQKSNIKQGPIFRSFYKGGKISDRRLGDHQVALITKKYVQSIGLNPQEYSGHSLRAGCATYLLRRKVPLNIVAKQLRHKRVDTTLRYDRNQVQDAISGLY